MKDRFECRIRGVAFSRKYDKINSVNKMDKQTAISRVSEHDEDRMLFARLYDRLTAAERKNIPGVTCFLSPREQVLTQKLLPELQVIFFGGHSQAERAIGCWLPDYLDETFLWEPDGPVAAVRATFYEKDALTHRDFLGGLMGIGIKRETVGDIYVLRGSCDFFVTREILPYVLDNFLSAGRTRLHVEEIPLEAVELPPVSVKEIRDTVSSLRLDSLVGSGFGMARGKAADLIAAGRVSINGLPCLKQDKLLEQGDQITARGFGKVILEQVGGRTKKDRISVVLQRLQ